MQELIIRDIIKSDFASDNEQGNLVFEKLKNKFKHDKNELICLDFTGLKLITTAFLNNAIGKLYKEFPVELISKLLKIRNIKDRDDLDLLRLVITNAMEMYKYKTKKRYNENV